MKISTVEYTDWDGVVIPAGTKADEIVRRGYMRTARHWGWNAIKDGKVVSVTAGYPQGLWMEDSE